MEPNDEELLELMPQQLRDDLATVSRMAAHGAGPDVTPGLFEASLTAGALQFVRVVLAAEAEGLAVPEGREPASAVGEPGDGNCWQWYTYCPEDGIELYPSREQAQSAAQSIMGSYAVAAHSDGWHEDMELASWGMLVPIERARAVERKTAEPGGEFDEWVKYELRPARAGLAEPVAAPAGPTDDELWDIGERHLWTGTDESVTNYRILTSFIEAARVVVARYGHQPAPPAEGEVAELVAALRSQAIDCTCDHLTSGDLRRAADLLEQHHPEPVPVSERLPGPEDCDAEGTCWAWHGIAATWGLFRLDPTVHSHWLPATALPLPAVEVQP